MVTSSCPYKGPFGCKCEPGECKYTPTATTTAKLGSHSSADIVELLPCPFCGSTALIDRDWTGHDDDGGYYEISCTNCSGSADRFIGVHSDCRQNAVLWWNTRASLQPATPTDTVGDTIEEVAGLIERIRSGSTDAEADLFELVARLTATGGARDPKLVALRPRSSPDIVERLNEHCVGHPYAKIEWPHRLLHDARDEIERLRFVVKTLRFEAESEFGSEARCSAGIDEAAKARTPKVRTSHHRNKEEAARLQELVDKKYDVQSSAAPDDVCWRRVNDEPFEYAIQQGPHGDEFVKLINGSCLRRTPDVAQREQESFYTEKQASDAPIWMSATAAGAWADGYNAALYALRSQAAGARTCTTCHAVLADGPQPAATYARNMTLADLITMIDMVENHTDAIDLADKLWPMICTRSAAQPSRAAVIEECAQVAEKYWAREVASQIRALSPFYGAQCQTYPNCTGGCGLGCTHEIEQNRRAMAVSSTDRAEKPSQDEMENYRLALAWITAQSTDPQAKEIAATALNSFTHSSPEQNPVEVRCPHCESWFEPVITSSMSSKEGKS